MKIDIHTHAFADEIAQEAIAKLEAGADQKAHGNGTVQSLVNNMIKSGIDYSVICSIATKPKQVSKIIDWSVKIKQQYSSVIPFASIYPDQNYKESIDSVVSHNLIGVKFHPYYQNFTVDDKKFYPMYEYLQKNHLIVLFHAGHDIAFPKDDRVSPKRLAQIQKDFPDLKLIAAHLGAWLLWDEVYEYMLDSSIFIDTAYIKGYITDEQMNKIFNNFSSKRILLGSDFPWGNQETDVSLIEKLDLSIEDKENIYYKNALKLFQSAGLKI